MTKGSAKKKFGLNDMFPVSDTVTTTALSNVFPEVEEAVKAAVQDIGRTYGNIALDKVVSNPFQPRKKFDQQQLQELADSLNADGMLQPILVRVSPTQSELYEIAAGERRWRAAKLAGWTHCPAEIMQSCPDVRMKRIALLENIQREQLAPLELAEVYDALLRETDASGALVYTVRSLAEMLKKNKDHVDEHRALLRVPADVRQLIEDDPDVPVRVIRELGNVEDVNDRAYLIEEVRARNLKTADIIAILQQRKRLQQMAAAPHLRNVPEAPPVPESQPEQAHTISAPLHAQQSATFLPTPEPVTAMEHERSMKKPSPVLALVVLERRLHKDQTQLEKVIGRITDELPILSVEEKTLVCTYLKQWCERIQQVVNNL